MSNEEQELELSMKEAKDKVALGNALERLMKNRDFNKIVKDGYFKDHAIRLVHLKGDANMQGEREQKNVDRDITAISSFRQYLDRIFAEADGAQEAIAACEEALDELRAEDDA